MSQHVLHNDEDASDDVEDLLVSSEENSDPVTAGEEPEDRHTTYHEAVHVTDNS